MMKVLAIGAGVLALGTGGYALTTGHAPWQAPPAPAAATQRIPLTITSANGKHVFVVELARTAAEQERGLMFRTDLNPDGGMVFWPYPPEGGPPRVANFWMKNTPTPLDILFIRADGTIARIAENTVPFSETPVPSGEPVGAVLELVGGRSAALGIAEGDSVSWPGRR
jgi:uncharacterized membrane protein (UPF0127 family)